MMKFKYYILGAIVIVAIALGWFFFLKPAGDGRLLWPDKGSKAEARSVLKKTPAKGAVVTDKKQLGPYYCPQVESLVKNKKGTKWIARDGGWTHYTPSSAKKILNFQGAQWIGIKIGKIICLYKTDEAVPFPIALEQTRIQTVLEPRTGGWSALVGNRRFCKSANVVDCPYYVEAPKDVGDVYQEIQYAPTEY